jgi:hypothetical protein
MTSDVPCPASTSPLDGRRFDGIVLERGSTRGDADTHGTVRGPRLDATLAMVRNGATVGEKWVLAGEC